MFLANQKTFVVCTGITLFALVLLILHWCYTFCTPFSANQNRVIFSCVLLGKLTDSALPLFNLLDVLTVNNVYRLHILKFTHLWHKGLLPLLFQNYFQYASSIHGYNTRYASTSPEIEDILLPYSLVSGVCYIAVR